MNAEIDVWSWILFQKNNHTLFRFSILFSNLSDMPPAPFWRIKHIFY